MNIEDYCLFEIISNTPEGFFVKFNGKIITSSFDGFSVSPASVNKGICSVRNAVNFRSEEKWGHLIKIKDGRKLKKCLRNLLLVEFDWWFLNGCEALAICVPNGDINYVKSVIKSEKNKGSIQVFSHEEPEVYQRWMRTKILRS